jgi:N-acetylglucosaminyldiphosphoundecaprenol N-acetyl-beta-D-mannosaminyltransferase
MDLRIEVGMRLLVLIDTLEPGGAERQLALTVTNLPKEWEVRCFALGGGPFEEYLRERGVHLEVAKRRWKYDPLPLLRLWATVIRWRPHLIHSWGYVTTLAGFPIYRALRIPFIDGTIRTGDVNLGRKSRSSAGMDRASLVVANSRAGLTSAHVSPERGRVVRNAFDFSRIPAAPGPVPVTPMAATAGQLPAEPVAAPAAPESVTAPRDDPRFTVVMAARMHPAKDYACFIAAARMLVAEFGPDAIRFLALGDGPDRGRLESEAHDLIEAGVMEFGSAPDVVGRLLECDCGVLMTSPSRVEGCPNTVLEYWAVGLPVVCSRGGGTDELVRHGETGLLVDPGDARGLADQVRWVYANREASGAMGARAGQMLRGEYSVEAMIRATEEAYAEAMAPKVLITVPHPARGGGIFNYFEALAPHLTSSTILRIGAPNDDQNRFVRLFRAVLDNVRLAGALVRSRTDIVHVNPTLNLRCLLRDGLSVLVARAFGRRTVVFFRGWDPRTESRLHGSLLRIFAAVFFRAGACVVLYSGFRAKLKEWGYRGPVHVLTTVVSDDCLEAVSAETIRARCRKQGRLRLLFMARLVEGKGLYETIEAYALARQRFPQLDLVIAGTGSEEAGAKAAALARGIPASAFVGDTRGASKVELLRTSDIFILPSETEGMPNAVLEALALGLTVITCPVGGLPDFFRDGELGFLAPDGSPDVLADLIVRACEDPRLREEMGLRGHALAKRHFSAALSARRLARIYSAVRTSRRKAEAPAEEYVWYEAEAAADTRPRTGVDATPGPADDPVAPDDFRRPVYNFTGVGVEALTFAQMDERIDEWVGDKSGRSRHLACLNAYCVALAGGNERLRKIYNTADIAAPDGMPFVRWIQREMEIPCDRLAGADIVLHLAERSRETGHTFYLYGGAPDVLERMQAQLRESFPHIRIVGAYSPPFRELTGEEDQAVVDEINALQPDILLVGLGTPKQDYWIDAHVDRLHGSAIIAVGAAFDFFGGRVRRAPQWVASSGFEWLYRLLGRDFLRLWKRYTYYNLLFVTRFLLQLSGLRTYPYERISRDERASVGQAPAEAVASPIEEAPTAVQ